MKPTRLNTYRRIRKMENNMMELNKFGSIMAPRRMVYG